LSLKSAKNANILKNIIFKTCFPKDEEFDVDCESVEKVATKVVKYSNQKMTEKQSS
jgi:hypothetical protein